MDAPVLRTTRLLLRLPRLSDAQALLDYQLRNRTRLAASAPARDEMFFSLPGQTKEIENALTTFKLAKGYRFLVFIEKDESRVVGIVAVTEIVRGAFQAAFLGYGIDGEREGEGLMTEAIEAVIKFAFDNLHLHRVMANVIPENERSQRLLRRLGFEFEGRAREYLLLDGRWRDHILTAKLNPRWIPQCEV